MPRVVELGVMTKTQTSVALTLADTQYSFTITRDMRNITLSLRDLTKAWRYSWTTGQVAGGAGSQVGAGFGAVQEAPVGNTALYFACGTAAMTMDITYEIAS